MGVFLVAGLIGAGLAASGASLGESWARAAERDRKRYALLGSVLAVWLGIAVFLVLAAVDLPLFDWSTALSMSAIWGVHGLLVSLAAGVGVLVAYNPRKSENVYVGPLLSCAFASGLTCLPLLLLTLH